jgi:hypothetical protein
LAVPLVRRGDKRSDERPTRSFAAELDPDKNSSCEEIYFARASFPSLHHFAPHLGSKVAEVTFGGALTHRRDVQRLKGRVSELKTVVLLLLFSFYQSLRDPSETRSPDEGAHPLQVKHGGRI